MTDPNTWLNTYPPRMPAEPMRRFAMSAYCFFDVREITDRAKVDQYLAGVFATVEQYGGHYLVFGGKFDRVEGNWQPV